MQLWLNSILILTTVGYVKTQHFIHFVVLGALGLIGLWLLSGLIKDVDKLFNKPSAAALTKPKFFLFKRSINNDHSNSTYEEQKHVNLNIDWERILTNDPLGCVKSFICQLAATESPTLPNYEKTILRLVRLTTNDDWAGKQIIFAMDYGKKIKESLKCRDYFSYCPYSIGTMMTIIKFFRST